MCDELAISEIYMKTKMLQKIIISTFFALFLLLSAQVQAAYCPNGEGQTAGSCENCQYATPDCGNCFVATSQQYVTTYCTQCSACVSGANDCIQGALGCNECNIATGYSDGYFCSNGSNGICQTDYSNACQ
jgi:hypothetical protein